MTNYQGYLTVMWLILFFLTSGRDEIDLNPSAILNSWEILQIEKGDKRKKERRKKERKTDKGRPIQLDLKPSVLNSWEILCLKPVLVKKERQKKKSTWQTCGDKLEPLHLSGELNKIGFDPSGILNWEKFSLLETCSFPRKKRETEQKSLLKITLLSLMC